VTDQDREPEIKTITSETMMEAKKESCTNQQLNSFGDRTTDDNKNWEVARHVPGANNSDHEQVEDSSIADDSDSSEKMTGEEEKKTKKRDFPLKLHEMLDDSKTHGREHIISWGPDGKSFKVHQPEDFVTEVMPMYFNQTKYRSFQRMLNLYNFKKIIVGPMRGGYIHPKFLRDNKELCSTMKIRTRAATRASYRSTSVHLPMPNTLRMMGFQQQPATTSTLDCDNGISSPQKFPQEMTFRFMTMMNNRQPVRPFFYQEENFDSTEMKEASSSTLNYLEPSTGQHQMEEQYLSSLPVRSVADHARYSLGWDAEMCHRPMSPIPIGSSNQNEQYWNNQEDSNNQANEIFCVNYDRIFQEPLSDDLEPRHLPPGSFDRN